MDDWRPFVYGGLASMTAEAGTFPIDTTKTRLQIQGQKIDAKVSQLKYRGMLHALVTIAREEGPRALYQGISPALLRQATYGTIKIGVYHSLKRMVVENPKDETLVVNVACGILAGIVSSSIANPTDVLKVRMQANTVMDERTSMVRSFIKIYRQEGVKGLWRGVVPTAQRAAIIAGVELPVYDFCKKYILRFELLGDTMVTHFIEEATIYNKCVFLVISGLRDKWEGCAQVIQITTQFAFKYQMAILSRHWLSIGLISLYISSFFAGLAGAIFSTPVDVVKTRLMNQKRLKMSVESGTSGATTPVIYKSSIDCIIQTVRHEGFMALYKGFVPSWVRLGPWNIIFFMTFEQLKKTY